MPSAQSSGKPWTRTDVRIMREAAKRRKSAKEVGRILGRTRGAVAYKAMVMGVHFHAINQRKGVQKRRFRKRR